MNPKQLNIFLGIAVVILLAVIGYMALRDNSQNDTLSQQNTTPNSNLANSNNNTAQPLSNTNTQSPTNSTIPTPSNNNQNNNLKTYTNAKYSFQVQYPSDYVVKEEGGYVSFRPLTSQKGYEENTKNCNDNNSQTPCNSEYYIAGNVSFIVEPGDVENMTLKGTKTFNGVKFNHYVGGGLFGSYTIYETLKNGVGLGFSANENSVPQMEQILSTFKFTK